MGGASANRAARRQVTPDMKSFYVGDYVAAIDVVSAVAPDGQVVFIVPHSGYGVVVELAIGSVLHKVIRWDNECVTCLRAYYEDRIRILTPLEVLAKCEVLNDLI